MGFIYALYNKNNNQVFYIGKTKQPINKRFNYHTYQLKSKTAQPVHNYINTNNIDFDIKIIEECENDIIKQRERFWMSHYGNSLQNISILCANEILCENCNKPIKIKNSTIVICKDCHKLLHKKQSLENKIEYDPVVLYENIDNFINRKQRSVSSIYQYTHEFNKIHFNQILTEYELCNIIINNSIWKSISMKKKVTIMLINYFHYLNMKSHQLEKLLVALNS